MKKLSLLLACIMVFASFALLNVSASDASYIAAYAETAPVIDGVLDSAWDAAYYETADVAKTYNMGTTMPPKFKVMHDDMYVYVLMEYEDLNGVIQQDGKHYGEPWKVGSETAIFAFIDDTGDQKEYMFTSPDNVEGALSTNTYVNVLRKWVKNLRNAEEGTDGFFAWAVRSNDVIVWEMRIPKEDIGDFDEDILMEVHCNDSGAPQAWSMEDYAWAAYTNDIHDYRQLLDPENFGTLLFAAQGEKVEPPVETEPVETEEFVDTIYVEPETDPVEDEPTENEPTETEPTETEPAKGEPKDEPKDEKDEPTVTDKTDDTAEPAAFPVVPVVIAAVVVLAIIIVVVVLKKKKAK